MSFIFLLALLGCGVDSPQNQDILGGERDGLDDVTSAPSAGGLRTHVTLGVGGPLYYGEMGVFDAQGCVNGETVYFVYSLNGAGAGSCPAPIGGQCLGVLDPYSVLGNTACVGTTASLVVPLPASGLDGLLATFQVAIPRGVGGVDSVLSNVITEAVTFNNTAPATNADNYNTDEDVDLMVDAASGVLANDSDADGDVMTAGVVTGPSNGGLQLLADGSLNYSPDANWSGVDTFTYWVTDGIANSVETTVTITVNAVNDAPFGSNDVYANGVIEDTPYSADALTGVLSNDAGDIEGDGFIAIMDAQPPAGEGTVTLSGDGSFDWAPGLNYDGDSLWYYRLRDDLGAESAPVEVKMRVSARNDGPTVQNQAYVTGRDTNLVVGAPGLLTGAVDADGPAPITAELVLVQQPSFGDVVVNSDGGFTYTPGLCYVGPDTFNFKARDGSGRAGDADGVADLDIGLGAPFDAAYCDAYDAVTPDYTYDNYSFQGFSTFSVVPANPVGIVYVFHGSDGDLGNVTNLEWEEFYNELYARNIAFVATESFNRTAKVWDVGNSNPNTNDEFSRLSDLRDDLVANNPSITASTPVAAIGFSNGGQYVDNFADMALRSGWDMRAMIIHSISVSTVANLPAIFVANENDQTGTPASVQSSYNNHANPNKAYYLHTETPTHPMVFVRNPTFDHQQSQDHFDEMVSQGGMDANGNRLVSVNQMPGFLSDYSNTTPVLGGAFVRNDMKIVWAMHQVSMEFKVEEADFLLSNF